MSYQPTPETIQQFLPENAYDVTVSNFVARWKTPNGYAASGFCGDARFLAASFLTAIRAEIPALKDWQIVNYENEPANDWSDRAALSDGTVKIWATMRGYGASAFSKVEISAYAIVEKGKYSSRSIEISASLSRTIAAIAKDISRRVLPELDAAKMQVKVKLEAERNAAAIISEKAEKLSKRFPNLRIRGDVENNRVSIETKYGSGIHLNCYAYQDSKSGKWRLTSERGFSIGLDDLDSSYGRAFLKLCNDN